MIAPRWMSMGRASCCNVGRRRVRRFLLLSIAMVSLNGCAPSHVSVPYAVEAGHTLSPADYAHLQKIADALPSAVIHYSTKEVSPSIPLMPLVRYAYAFRPGVDVTKLRNVVIAPFSGAPGEAAKTAADLPSIMVRRLWDEGITAIIGPLHTPDAYVISGTVTRVGTSLQADPVATATQAEVIISRNNEVLGIMQANAAPSAKEDIFPELRTFTFSTWTSPALIVSGPISEALRRAKSGQREGAAPGRRMSIPVSAGVRYRLAPVP